MLGSVLIFGLALGIRLVNLYGVPVFIDESHHLAWAQSFAVGESAYPFLMDGKFLTGIILAQFQVTGAAPLWQARAAAALLSLISCAACIALGRQLGSRKTGLLAGLLYALLPFAVFHERQVLADPLMGHFGALILVFTARVARRPRWHYLFVLGMLVAAACLAKLTGVLYVIPLLVAVVILPARQQDRGPLAARYAFSLCLAAAATGLLLASLSSRLGQNNNQLTNGSIGFVGCPALVCQGSLREQVNDIQQALAIALPSVPIYFGWPLIALAALAWPASRRGVRRQAAFLFISASGMLLAFWLTARNAPPRYYTFLAVPVTALAARGLIALAPSSLSFAAPRNGFKSLGALLLIALAFQAAIYTGPIVLNPEQAQLPTIDQWQYFTGWPAGTGLDQAALYLLAQPSDQPRLVIAKLLNTLALPSYFDSTQARVISWQENWLADLGRALLGGQPAFVVEEVPRDEPASVEPIPGLTTTLLASYDRLNGENLVRVRRVEGANAMMRQAFFEALCVRPDRFDQDYQALARSLAGESWTGVLLAYPPNQTAVLSDALHDQKQVVPYPIGDSWPLDRVTTTQALNAVTAGRSTVRIAFTLETGCDPQRWIETWLTTHLFRTSQQWFGPVRLVEFAALGDATQALPVSAKFGDAITLEQVEIMDSRAQVDGVLGIRLTWRADRPPAQSLKVFAHVFRGDNIVAQHDGEPDGELRPTTSWLAGERVVDQFAIRLPRDIAPGTYQLRIGLYDSQTLARVRVQLADGSTGEFYVGGTITIK